MSLLAFGLIALTGHILNVCFCRFIFIKFFNAKGEELFNEKITCHALCRCANRAGRHFHNMVNDFSYWGFISGIITSLLILCVSIYPFFDRIERFQMKNPYFPRDWIPFLFLKVLIGLGEAFAFSILIFVEFFYLGPNAVELSVYLTNALIVFALIRKLAKKKQ